MKIPYANFKTRINDNEAVGGCTFIGLSGVSQNIDLLIFDGLKTRFPKKYLFDSPSVVIGISEKDIEKYGWPIDDKYLLETIQKCAGWDHYNHPNNCSPFMVLPSPYLTARANWI